jgi:PAS domain S-box-containing protein
MTMTRNETAPSPPPFGGFEHAVQFYEQDDFLCDRVADFVADGLLFGEPAVVIATSAHRDGIAERLATSGCDLDRVTFLDARETLERFMDGVMPDEDGFRSAVGEALARANGGGRVRAYGEMVDLLWRDENPDGAIRLEELWNDLAGEYDFSLLCAYPIGNFHRETHAELFATICARHAQVIPTEAYVEAADEDARLREISALQQRAAALENEIMHRKELEQALREALAARREAEEAVRRSERELKDFVENAAIALHWIGPDGTILWANDAELNLLGYTRDEYIGRNIVDFHADRDVIEDILRRLAARQQLNDYEVRLVAKDGSIRHVALSSNVFFEDGKFVHTRCFTRDITDRKRLDDERRRAEEVNAFLLEASNTLNRSLDYDSCIREITNLVAPRLADSCSVEIVRDEAPAEELQAAIEDDGTRLVVPMLLPDRPVGTLTLMSNSDRRFTSDDLPVATEVARRGAVALENARLYRLAQESNRTKDEFLATLSHELRTPLTAILGWARMLTLGGLDDETRRVAYETIERSARTQATLIDDLLDLSRVVTGKLTLQNELVDLSSIIDNAVQTQRLAADAKGIGIDVKAAGERAVVNGDPTRLQQIVWNLVSNAIKFSNAGGSVSVELERDAEYARIIVRDSGRGIPLDFLPHVFEPFRQADGASTRKHGGLGLGLAIVKYITELHGGSVRASSRGEGRGATFMVTLPLALRRAAASDVLHHDEIVDLRGTTVLLVDDDASTRDLVMAMLRRCGAEVCAAESVAAARSLLGVSLPHVVVTDIAMPELDGFDLLNYVHSLAPKIPVVALTASAQNAADQARFSAWVRKPIDPFEFARVIADLN